jgi:hypothetical protein
MAVHYIRNRLSGFWPAVLAIVLIFGLSSGLALAKVAKSPPKAPPVEKTEFGPAMSFTVLRLSSSLCEPRCPQWIAADGEITDMTPAKLAKLLANVAYRKLPIVINSPGGKIDAAMIIGRLIRKYDMNVAVASSSSTDCFALSGTSNTCASDGKVHRGYTLTAGGYCNSACSLVLLGGRVRIAGPKVSVGLHQPHGESQHWVDHYWDTWRMVNGKKIITSHRFIKRTYDKPKNFVGVTADMKPKYLRYFKEMGASPQILDEMAKASPATLNEIPYTQGGGPRQKLGLVTAEDLDITALVSTDHCKTFGKLSSNCVLVKDYVAQPAQQDAQPCFVLSGCGPAKKLDPTAKGVPCFTANGCSDADKIATQEWLGKKQQPAAAMPCFIESGCSKTDKPVSQDTARNGEADMSFTLMRLDSSQCEPRCPEWIAAEGWIVEDTAKKFDTFLTNTGVNGLPVFVQSNGGDFNAAMEMGRIIHKNGLDTAVANSSISRCPGETSTGPCNSKNGVANLGFGNVYGAYCLRACTIVLLAGRNRAVALDTIVGVDATLPDDRTALQDYLISISQSFGIVKAMETARSYDDINKITRFSDLSQDGFISKPYVNLMSFIGDHKCQTSSAASENCVDLETTKKPQ